MALPPIGNNTQKGNFSITEHRSKLRHFVVGTGGHIDHGKSTLVKALTLTDPDRFIEEKKRGITIDLGFASYKADEDLEISFIDVPGHEKFVHNMLAGIGGVEMFLLVVAADGGVMPQTREHLAIADLLKIQKGLVVLSRLDLADEEMTDLVFEEVKELTKGSFLEDKPIVKVSAQTGLGLDELKKQLALTANSPVAPRKEQPFRMPIDRSFSIKGFGTVITGTVLSGSASLRDPLWLYPQKIPLKPRSFENHKNKVEEVHSGQRLAVNLGGIHKDQIERGNQIAKPNSVYNTRRVDVELSLVPGIKAIKNKSLIRFYSNAQEVTGNITFVDKTFSPDQKVHFAQIRLIDEVCLRYGDRFILRNLSPSETIAGGKILAPLGNRYRRNKSRITEIMTGLSSEVESDRVTEVLSLSGTKPLELELLSVLVGIAQKNLLKILQKLQSQGKIVLIQKDEKLYLHAEHALRIADFFVKALSRFHQKFPEKKGAPASEFSGKMNRILSAVQISHLLEWSVKQDLFKEADRLYHLADFKGSLSKDQSALKEKILGLLKGYRFQPPGLVNLSVELEFDQKELKKLLMIGHAERWAVKVNEDQWFHPEAIDQARKALVEFLSVNDKITVIEFKDLLDVTRKNAIGLLEYFDGIHLTRRVENHRILLR